MTRQIKYTDIDDNELETLRIEYQSIYSVLSQQKHNPRSDTQSVSQLGSFGHVTKWRGQNEGVVFCSQREEEWMLPHDFARFANRTRYYRDLQSSDVAMAKSAFSFSIDTYFKSEGNIDPLPEADKPYSAPKIFHRYAKESDGVDSIVEVLGVLG